MKTEQRLQADCYKVFHNQYPELRGLFCYNLNNSTGVINAGVNKVMGLQAGRSDMVFYYKGIATMIEFKTETGVQTETQKEWQNLIEKHGFKYYIVRNLKDFQKIICTITN